MTTEEKIKVMQAYVDGKQIQTRAALFKGNWVDVNIEPSWDWALNDYRIKPEVKKPTYRPYKDTEEMIADYKERFKVDVPPYAMPLIWIRLEDNSAAKFITAFRADHVTIDGNVVSLGYIHHAYVYIDGSPCGKLVEE